MAETQVSSDLRNCAFRTRADEYVELVHKNVPASRDSVYANGECISSRTVRKTFWDSKHFLRGNGETFLSGHCPKANGQWVKASALFSADRPIQQSAKA